ncbi:hypothetical protein [Streptomyces sp. NPDC058855]|uniref:hypothetical protein n=1 Tax=Streptomyces sp. NPDC058855 TaxID=3346651 RepID=UPI0036933A14
MTRRVRARWCGVLLLTVVLAAGASGCGTEAPSSPAGSSSPGPTTTTGQASPPRQEPSSQEVLVEVVVTGGFAGVRNRLVVHEDGGWTLDSRTKEPRGGRMTPDGVARLRAALEDPAYDRVPAEPTGEPVRDGFQYTVTHGQHRVVATDGAVPPALRRVLDALPEGGPPTSP